MKLSCLVLLAMLTVNSLLSQNKSDRKRSVFFELAGSGGLGSINYESQFFQNGSASLTFRSGLSFAPIDRNNGTGLVFPLMVNAIIGKNNHRLEAGIGQGVTITTRGSFYILTTMVVGYRFQRPASPWFYRISYTPLLSYLLDIQYQHWGGLSIGYTLPKRNL